MRQLQVNWSVRHSGADGAFDRDWRACPPPDDAVVALAIRENATVRLTYSDGSASEWAVSGISDIGPNDSASLKY